MARSYEARAKDEAQVSKERKPTKTPNRPFSETFYTKGSNNQKCKKQNNNV